MLIPKFPIKRNSDVLLLYLLIAIIVFEFLIFYLAPEQGMGKGKPITWPFVGFFVFFMLIEFLTVKCKGKFGDWLREKPNFIRDED